MWEQTQNNEFEIIQVTQETVDSYSDAAQMNTCFSVFDSTSSKFSTSLITKL